MFNTIFNATIVLSSIIKFLGTLGGLAFLFCSIVDLWESRHQTPEEKPERCESCQNYETCEAVMQDCLPDFACAYWAKKKP